MILLEDCITDETIITGLKLKTCAQAVAENGREVYFKSFSINEIIGQRLAMIRKLKSNKYFFTLLGNKLGNFKFKSLDPRRIEDIKIGSYDFKKKIWFTLV